MNDQYCTCAAVDHIYSVNEVTAQLERLHGQTLRIAGVLRIEFEDNCLSHFPARGRLPDYGSSLWAEFDVDRLAKEASAFRPFNGRRVTVIATIDKDEHGHFGLWPGGVLIQNVAKYKVAETT